MKRIEAIIRPTIVGKVCASLEKEGLPGPRISQIEDKSPKDTGYLLRGTKYRVPMVTKAKIEVIVNNNDTDKVIRSIREAAFTGDSGDGEIFVYAIEDSILISTGETREAAVH